MYITKKDFEMISKALLLLPSGNEFNQLPKEKQDIIVAADGIMVNILKKYKKQDK